MQLKGLHFADVAEIQEAVTDEWKKVQQEEFSAAFQKLHDRAKTCIYIYMPIELILNKMKKACVFDLKKKSVLELLDRAVYVVPQLKPLYSSSSTLLDLLYATISEFLWHVFQFLLSKGLI